MRFGNMWHQVHPRKHHRTGVHKRKTHVWHWFVFLRIRNSDQSSNRTTKGSETPLNPDEKMRRSLIDEEICDGGAKRTCAGLHAAAGRRRRRGLRRIAIVANGSRSTWIQLFSLHHLRWKPLAELESACLVGPHLYFFSFLFSYCFFFCKIPYIRFTLLVNLNLQQNQ
jgi:hypothetical protein